MEKNRKYECPKTDIVRLNVVTPFLDDPIHQGGPSKNNVVDAKEQGDVIDDETDLAAPIKDKWGDLSEKKIAK
jgi:hypothetical protein